MTAALVHEQVNPFAVERSEPQSKGMLEVAASRQAQEVQAAMVVAKRFPRDPFESYNRIMNACKRISLAKDAIYTYPRGGTTVKGPSIRLAEVLAQQWGNIDFGIIELEQRYQESTVMAYAWDLETNTRQTKVFAVPHKRYTKNGSCNLTDPRDIYEMVANNGARRLRACILGVIPGDIIDGAVEACNDTLLKDDSEGPLEDRIRKMVMKFSEVGVSTDMLEMRLGHKLEITTVQEVVNLAAIYKSISDNMAPIEQYFERPETAEGKTQTLKDKMAAKLNRGKDDSDAAAHKPVDAPVATAPKKSGRKPATAQQPEQPSAPTSSNEGEKQEDAEPQAMPLSPKEEHTDALLEANAAAVNEYLVQTGKIKPGQTYRDTEGVTRIKAYNQPEQFLRDVFTYLESGK